MARKIVQGYRGPQPNVHLTIPGLFRSMLSAVKCSSSGGNHRTARGEWTSRCETVVHLTVEEDLITDP